jgi:molybdenum cofactor synthesis domain-containing protein
VAGVSTAAIALIGDEILSGKVVDENAQLLIHDLRELGLPLKRIVVLPDVVEEIADTVAALSAKYTHVFTSGGVGPTHDDLTMEGVARAFSVGVARHPVLEGLLRGYYGERLQERNLRMADVPEGAVLVEGTEPSWPVVSIRNVYILPGVPQIFAAKWRSIKERFRQAPFFLQQVYTTLGEGDIAHHLDRIVAEHPGVQLGSYPRIGDPDYRVKVTLEGKDQASVDAATKALTALLAPHVIRVE